MKVSLPGLTGWICCTLMLVTTAWAQQTNNPNQQQAGGTEQQAGSTQQQALQPKTGQQSPQANNYEQQLRQQQQQTVQPQQPDGFPLSAEEQQYIDQLLAFWEGTSAQVQRYRCDFTRWQYDHVTCNFRDPRNNQLVAAMISKGKVRYSDPDKGMYEVLEMWQFAGPPETEGGDPRYVRPAAKNKGFVETEKWICDGEKIYEYDYQNKRLYELTLPPQAQGAGLKNSPLPFVFGCKAAELKERFWIRDVTPAEIQKLPPEKQQYWLECWPKRINDAQAYSKVEIVLSRDPFLPMSIHMYSPNYDQKTNPQKMVFQFENRQINGTLDNLADFMKNFINPRTPLGWDRVPRNLAQEPVEGQTPRVGEAPQNAGNANPQGQ